MRSNSCGSLYGRTPVSDGSEASRHPSWGSTTPTERPSRCADKSCSSIASSPCRFSASGREADASSDPFSYSRVVVNGTHRNPLRQNASASEAPAASEDHYQERQQARVCCEQDAYPTGNGALFAPENGLCLTLLRLGRLGRADPRWPHTEREGVAARHFWLRLSTSVTPLNAVEPYRLCSAFVGAHRIELPASSWQWLSASGSSKTDVLTMVYATGV